MAEKNLVDPLPKPNRHEWAENPCSGAAPAHIRLSYEHCRFMPESDEVPPAQQFRQQFESMVADGHVAHLAGQHDVELAVARRLIDRSHPNIVAEVEKRAIVNEEVAVETIERGSLNRADQNVLDIGIQCSGCGGERPFVAETVPPFRAVVTFAR